MALWCTRPSGLVLPWQNDYLELGNAYSAVSESMRSADGRDIG